MALGTYGTTRPSDMSPEDVEIILNYTPSRDVTNDFELKKLNATEILTPYFHNDSTGGNANVEILGGMYNLKLPADEFNEIGIYTLYIRPVEIRTTITDCGVLSSLPSQKGQKLPSFFCVLVSKSVGLAALSVATITQRPETGSLLNSGICFS